MNNCLHLHTKQLSQQGFEYLVCKDCGDKIMLSNIKPGKPKQYKKLLEWAPCRLFRRKKK